MGVQSAGAVVVSTTKVRASPTAGSSVKVKRWLAVKAMFSNCTVLTCLDTLAVLVGVAPLSVILTTLLRTRPATEKGLLATSAESVRLSEGKSSCALRPLMVWALTASLKMVSNSPEVRTLSW